MSGFLLSLGFVQRGCNCGGKKHYEKDGIEIILFTRSSSYEIRKDYQVINRGMSSQLRTEYDKLFS